MGDSEIEVFLVCYWRIAGEIEMHTMMQSIEDPTNVYFKGASPRSGYRLGIDAFETRDAALRAVQEMKDAQIESRKSEIARLEAMTLTVVPGDR